MAAIPMPSSSSVEPQYPSLSTAPLFQMPPIQRTVSATSSAGDIMDPVADDDQSHRPAKIQRIDEELSVAKISVDGQKEQEDPSEWSVEESDAEDDSAISDAASVGDDGSDAEEFSDEEFSEEEFSDDEDEDELNEETLLRIKRNDLAIASLAVRELPIQETCLVDVGRSIGESTSLKKLSVKGELIDWCAEEIVRFMQFSSGFACNQSIENFMLRECTLGDVSGFDTIRALSPLFEFNTNLQSVKINGCEIGDKSSLELASILSRRENKTSLQCVCLDANRIGDEAASVLIDALVDHKNLVELSLGDNEIATRGSASLGKLLSNSNTKLERLNLENNQLCSIAIAHLTGPLADGPLAKNKSLRELNLSMNTNITHTGWHLLSKCLHSGKSSIEKLDISSNNFGNGGAISFGKALTKNTNLKTLNLFDLNTNGVPLVTGTGWESFFNCLRAPAMALSQIDLRYSSIDEEGLNALARALPSNSSVKMLDLSHNAHIPVAAWKSFFAQLKSSTFALKDLYLGGNTITDDEMSDIANALVKNDTLEMLIIQPLFTITSAGWAHFRRLLCKSSSIMDIYTSNHTLRQIGELDIHKDRSLQRDILHLLDMNKSGNKNEIARKKILQYHFCNGERNVQDMLEVNLKVMPHAISWMGRDDLGGNLLYQALRGLPSLFVSENRKNAMSGVKRKFDPCPWNSMHQ